MSEIKTVAQLPLFKLAETRVIDLVWQTPTSAPAARPAKSLAAAVDGTTGIVPPSYWTDLVLYTTPGESRPAIALVGPAGNGKTTAAEAVCRHHGYEYLVIDANEYLEPADLIGAPTFDPAKGEVWKDGPVTRAFREGKAVIINEFDALNPRAAMCLQSVMQDGGPTGQGRYVTTPGAAEHDRVFPEGDCPLILTMNTYGTGATRDYVGRNTLDAASLDRITVISTGYENEAAILVQRGYSHLTATQLETWAAAMRTRIEDNALRVILSLRTLQRMAQMMDRFGRTLETAIQKEFMSRLDPAVRDLLS